VERRIIPERRMAVRKRNQILACTIALLAVIAFLSASSRTNLNLEWGSRQRNDLGSAEEAFNVASKTIKERFSNLDGEPVVIDSQFRATLLSKSKLWTIKGYASCPNEDSKAYRWTVILNYHDMQDWEVLGEVVTPEYTASNLNQTMGTPQAYGKLFQTHQGH
jgi:hypothetical protein